MKQVIKRIIFKSNRIKQIFYLIKFLIDMRLKVNPLKKKYPKVIQLPITKKCNSKCVMCNVWKMDNSNEISIEEFEKIMSDKIFKEVKAVGINGGEPSLVKDLDKYVEIMIENLKNLKSINLISHGFSSKLLLSKLEKIYKICKENNIYFSVLISLDGVGEIHNIIRGKKNVFSKTLFSIKNIKNNQAKYCDNISLRCTLTKQNIEYWKELEVFVKKELGLDIEYGIAVDIKRIDNLSIHSNFSILESSYYKQIAKELFFSKYIKSQNLYEKFKYYALYYYLEYQKRLLGCSWKDRDITLDSEGNIYYCAVESKKLGNLLENCGENIFFNENNLKYRKEIVKNKCEICIHDYTGDVEFKNGIIFLKEFLFHKLWIKFYKIKLFFIRG